VCQTSLPQTAYFWTRKGTNTILLIGQKIAIPSTGVKVASFRVVYLFKRSRKERSIALPAKIAAKYFSNPLLVARGGGQHEVPLSLYAGI